MKKVFFFTVIIIGCFRLNAQVTFKTEYLGTSSYQIMEGDTYNRVGNSKGSAVVYSGGINIPLSTKLDENHRPTMWSASVGVAYAKLNNQHFDTPLVLDEVMNWGVNLTHLRPLNEQWSLLATVGGGVYMPNTNFSKIGHKNILGGIGSIFIYHLRPNLDIGVGIALNNSFGYPMIFPTLYLNWNVKGSYAIKVALMEGLEMSAGYSINKNLDVSVVAEANGQMALFEQHGKDKIFSHQYIVTGFRPEIKLGAHVSIPITVGIHAIRPAEIMDRSLKSMFQDRSYYFKVSPYVSAGLQVGF